MQYFIILWAWSFFSIRPIKMERKNELRPLFIATLYRFIYFNKVPLIFFSLSDSGLVKYSSTGARGRFSGFRSTSTYSIFRPFFPTFLRFSASSRKHFPSVQSQSIQYGFKTNLVRFARQNFEGNQIFLGFIRMGKFR